MDHFQECLKHPLKKTALLFYTNTEMQAGNAGADLKNNQPKSYLLTRKFGTPRPPHAHSDTSVLLLQTTDIQPNPSQQPNQPSYLANMRSQLDCSSHYN
ncbi:hypothetical protein J6590_083857 [Homalodisca vitripennis]|nr:hypothetical protein J6590_083857 [Homalodisca vitripennis]